MATVLPPYFRGHNLTLTLCTVLKLVSTESSLFARSAGVRNSEWPKRLFVTPVVRAGQICAASRWTRPTTGRGDQVCPRWMGQLHRGMIDYRMNMRIALRDDQVCPRWMGQLHRGMIDYRMNMRIALRDDQVQAKYDTIRYDTIACEGYTHTHHTTPHHTTPHHSTAQHSTTPYHTIPTPYHTHTIPTPYPHPTHTLPTPYPHPTHTLPTPYPHHTHTHTHTQPPYPYPTIPYNCPRGEIRLAAKEHHKHKDITALHMI